MIEDFKLHNKSFNFYTFIHDSLISDNKMEKIYFDRNKYFPSNEYSQICDSYRHLFNEL